MAGPLTGYEAESIAEVGAVLDDSPANANEVYQRTIGHSERAIAAVAAKRAGSGGGSLPSQWTVDAHGNFDLAPDDPTVDHLVRITAPADFADQTLGDGALFEIEDNDGYTILYVDIFGNLRFKAPVGQGHAGFVIGSADFPLVNAVLSQTRLGIGQGADPGVIDLDAGGGDAIAVLVSNAGAGPGTAYAEPYFAMFEAGGAQYLFSIGMAGGITVWDGHDAVTRSWWVTSDGYEAMTARGEPPDDDILPGQVFSYFDATDGAAKFWRKGKTLDGTVVKSSAAMT